MRVKSGELVRRVGAERDTPVRTTRPPSLTILLHLQLNELDHYQSEFGVRLRWLRAQGPLKCWMEVGRAARARDSKGQSDKVQTPLESQESM